MSDTNDNNEGYGVSPFQRNNYFYGKLMAVRDFEDEQDYMNKKRHLLNRMIDGFGIVCGSDEWEVSTSKGNIKIKFNSGGMAIDRWGREIVIPVGLEKDVFLEESLKSNLTASDVENYPYLYLEYKEGKGEMVIDVSDDPGTQESCSYNRVIEDFQVVASTEVPKIPTISCPAPFGDDMTPETAKQEVKEWLQKETSNLCSEPEEKRVFILALKQTDGDVEIDHETTADHLSFVVNNRVFSELLACHLADFENPHKSLVGLEAKNEEDENVKVYNEDGYITIEKFNAITLTPDEINHKITIGETHSGETGNPHQTKHSEIKEVLPVDPTKDDEVMDKHISNNDAKKWNQFVEESGIRSIAGVVHHDGDVGLEAKNSITIEPDDENNKITIGETHSTVLGNPHQTKHSQLDNVLAVFDDEDNETRNKHVSNTDAIKWNKAAEEPVGLKSIGHVENPGGNIDLAAQNAIEIFPDDVKNLITISETHSGKTDNPHKVGMSHLIDLDASGRKITSLAKPERGKDAANKRYVDEKTGATVGSGLNIENVTTKYTRQLNVSDNSTARGERSQVNASVGSTAGGARSQVNASWRSEANHYNSQVNASWGTASGSAFTVCGGFGMEGGPSPNNRKWELNSKNGDITHAGSINSHASFSDYGEYFENLKKGEIDMGVLIALEGANVRPAKKGEDFIGAVSGTAAIRLGDSPFGWQGRFLKDEWGRPVYEEIKDPAWLPKTVPDEKWKPKKGQTEADRPMKAVETEKDRPTIRVQKENPDYDPGRESAPRSQRPREWTLVGLLGQVYVRCDDTVKPGDFVKSGGKGIGTMSEEKTKLRAMKVTKEFDGKYAIVYCLLL
jgi:hypothetical protein